MNSQFTEQKRKERISYLLAKERYDYEDLLLIVKI